MSPHLALANVPILGRAASTTPPASPTSMSETRPIGHRQRVLARFVRIYASTDQYGPGPRTPPPQPEMSLPDFPRAGATVRVYFGEVPADLVTGLHHRMVIAEALLQAMFGQLSQPIDDEVDRMLQEQPRMTFEEASWYVTFVADLPVEVALLDGPRHQWVDIRETEVDEAFWEEGSATLDSVAAVIADVLGRGHLNRRATEDFTLYTAPGRNPCLVPRFSGRATASVGRAMTEFPGKALVARLEALRNLPSAELSGLRRAMSWLHAGRLAEDPWRRFQSAWFALELMTHRLSRRYRSSVVARLAEGGADPPLPVDVVAEMLWERERMPLTARFAIVASRLSPQTAAADTAEFRRLKQARDDVSHGSVTNTAALPIDDVEVLAGRYLGLALEDITGGD